MSTPDQREQPTPDEASAATAPAVPNAADLDVLAAQLSGTLVTDPDVVDAASRDRSPVEEVGRAIAVVRAACRDDVVATLRWANEHHVPVITRGAGTGLSGGANAIDGCIVLDVSRMNAIKTINPAERIAVVEPGVLNGDLSDAVREQGLFYPPDPGSWRISSIGGNVATNAGGLCCVKYGVTKKFVRALEVVLADGSVMRTGTPTAKGVAGYDLTGLIVGSEGTLGVVTEVTLALVPAPDDELVAVALFDSASRACEVAATYLEAGGRPSMLEFMDGPTLAAVQRMADLGFDESVDGMLIVGCDDATRQDVEFAAFSRLAEEAGAEVFVAESVAESLQFTAARRLVGNAFEAMGRDLVDDVCVPLRRTGELVDGVRALGKKHRVRVATAGHLGDGNMHPAVLYSPGDTPEAVDEKRRAYAAFEEIMQLGLDLGGTITGEHGVGRLKASMLPVELGETNTRIQRELRRVFDPNGTLNPGVNLASDHS